MRQACHVLYMRKGIIEEIEEEDYEIEETLDIKKLNIIANGNYWKEIIQDYNKRLIDFHVAEERLVEGYTKSLKSLFKYIIKIPIKLKIKNIPKYRMIFMTNHPDGFIIMADNMSRIWQNIVNLSSKGQESLLKDFELYEQGLDIIEDKVIEILKNNALEIDLKTLYLELIKYYGVEFSKSNYNEKIKALENNGFIKIMRNPKLTKTGKINRSFNYKENKINIILNNNGQ